MIRSSFYLRDRFQFKIVKFFDFHCSIINFKSLIWNAHIKLDIFYRILIVFLKLSNRKIILWCTRQHADVICIVISGLHRNSHLRSGSPTSCFYTLERSDSNFHMSNSTMLTDFRFFFFFRGMAGFRVGGSASFSGHSWELLQRQLSMSCQSE